MRNANRAVFDRASERYDLAFEMAEPAIEQGFDTQTKSTLANWLLGLGAKFKAALRARGNRTALLELSDEQLKDIGLSRSQAYGDPHLDRHHASHGLERRCL